MCKKSGALVSTFFGTLFVDAVQRVFHRLSYISENLLEFKQFRERLVGNNELDEVCLFPLYNFVES